MTTCPKCGTMLDRFPNHPDMLPVESEGYEDHDAERCRDVLHAQLTAERAKVEEARNELDLAADRFRSAMHYANEAVRQAKCGEDAVRAALEKLRGQ